MVDLLAGLVTVVYFCAAGGLLLYALNCYVLIFLFRRRRSEAEEMRRDVRKRQGDLTARDDLPAVTTQIPLFNEYNVAVRVMEAACAMEYPDGRHEIQVLDDSTDETRGLVDITAARLRKKGHRIRVIRRQNREGYKAGALEEGTRQAAGDLLAIFDADFVPPPDFLLRTVPFFLDDPKLGLVQARWGHLNPRRSLLTRAQSVGIDGHFMVEQSARAWNGLFMNFNGTAGIWRRQGIEAAGGWSWDTLTEDMDLSYRMQMAGWGAVYLPDLVVPAEIPEVVTALKTQQFRWAKGSTQTAMKLLPAIWRSGEPLFKKLQATMHMTHYIVHPLMLTLALFALPVLLTLDVTLGTVLFTFLAAVLTLAMMAPSSLYLVSQQAAYRDWPRRVLCLPALVVMGVGLAVSNSRAVAEALIGRKSGFIRTPKKGDREKKRYRVRLPWTALVELGVGAYCAGSLTVYLMQGKYLVGPFLAMYAAGFLFIGLLTLAQHFGLEERFSPAPPPVPVGSAAAARG